MSEIKLYKRRWLILLIFALISMTNGYQWIQYSTIANIVMKFYGVSAQAVNWTSLIYMALYAMVFIANYIVDKYGIMLGVLLGSFGNATAAWLKVWSASGDRFWLTFAAQSLAGASQIFILGMPAFLAVSWFGANEVSTATSLGVFGNSLGIALGFLLPPMFVSKPEPWDQDQVASELRTMFIYTAVASSSLFVLVALCCQCNLMFVVMLTIASAVVVTFIRSALYTYMGFALIPLPDIIPHAIIIHAPPTPPSHARAALTTGVVKEESELNTLKKLATNPQFILLFLSYGLNIGVGYVIQTLLNETVLHYYPGEEVNVGRIGLLIVVAGLAGAVLVGVWLDKTHKYWIASVLIYIITLLCTGGFLLVLKLGELWSVFVVSAVLGFFLMSYLPLGFEYAAELTYPLSEASTSGMLNIAAQIGGISLTTLTGILNDKFGYEVGLLMLCGALAIGSGLTALIREDLKRVKAERERLDEVGKSVEIGQQPNGRTTPRDVVAPAEDPVNLENSWRF